MRRGLAVLLPLLLAGCGAWPFGSHAPRAEAPPNPLRAQCEQAIYDDDPQFKEAMTRYAGMVGYAPILATQERDKAKAAALQRCIQKRGGGKQRGGVEIPQ